MFQVSVSNLTCSLSSLIPVTWNLYCAAYSVKLISLTVNVRAAPLGKRKSNYFANLYSGCTASGHRLWGDLIQKTLQAQVHCAGRINKFIQVWINTLGSCYYRKEGGRDARTSILAWNHNFPGNVELVLVLEWSRYDCRFLRSSLGYPSWEMH